MGSALTTDSTNQWPCLALCFSCWKAETLTVGPRIPTESTQHLGCAVLSSPVVTIIPFPCSPLLLMFYSIFNV